MFTAAGALDSQVRGRECFKRMSYVLCILFKGPHKCMVCGQEFSQMKLLQRHWRAHAEDKPHQCDECNASFNKQNNLLLHKATHCTSDPSCPICKRKFSRLASLKAHLMLHEVEEYLTCSECGDEFSTQVCENIYLFIYLLILMITCQLLVTWCG